MTKPIYESIGTGYNYTRCTDPDVYAQLAPTWSGATRILNVGAGSGSYEPQNVPVVAVEPSRKMIAQRPTQAHPSVCSYAETLPFGDHVFSHCLSVLTLHHWHDRAAAYAEIKRVTQKRFITLTWDPDAPSFWLTEDYFPEILAADRQIFPTMDELAEHFGDIKIIPMLIPAACQDGFFAAFWKRPQAYLDPEVRRAMSPFAKRADNDPGTQRLQQDLADGTWAAKYTALESLQHFDAGYRIVYADLD